MIEDDWHGVIRGSLEPANPQKWGKDPKMHI